jgi:N-formylmaleamate deformylase
LKGDDTSSSYLYGAHVRANGIRQHYLRYGGKGEPLIVIPGITSPAITWGFVGERLGHNYDTYVLDTRGRGLSEAPADADYGLDAYAKDAAGFAEALGISRYHVLGHSMGGRIAARMGALYGARLARLILVDPPLSGPGRRPYVKDLKFYLDSLHEARAGLLDAEKVRRIYPGWNQEQLRQRAEWLHTCDDVAIEKTLRGFNEEDVHGDLAALRVPTLLLAAGKGGVILDADIAELRALAPSIEVRRIEHCGHLIPFDDLDAFISSVETFLA